jgi:MFS family permease
MESIDTNIGSNPILITANRNLSGNRLRNFYLTNAFQWFVWMIFHFSMVFFFTFQLENVFLVGIFLWIANFIAFLLDIPIGILQRYFSTKKLFTIAALSQLIATAIFFNFIYEVFSEVGSIGKAVIPEWFESILGWFFGDFINWTLIIIASFCYGLTKEINDISTYGYILSNASPSEYSTILARNNITYGLGSLSGLVLSGIILSINPTIAVITLAVIIVFFLLFTLRFFDNSYETVKVADIVSFTLAVKKLSKENIREYLSERIQVSELPKILSSAKYIFLKPLTLETTKKIEMHSFIAEGKQTAKTIWGILGHMPPFILIYWTMSLVLIFGFWDTFAATFLIQYLDGIAPGWSYMLLAFIAIPALWLQEFAGKLAKKIGIKSVAFFWLWLSGVSLLAMGIFWSYLPWVAVIFLAVINSIWYACWMALGQNGFLENYNKIYATSNGLTEIDANAAAGPMKILQNLANVIGLMLWGIILSILWYSGFFIIFWLIILFTLVWSIRYREYIEI